MSFLVHQIVNAVCNPVFVGLAFVLAILICCGLGLRRFAQGLAVTLFVLGLTASLPITSDMLAAWLERDYPACDVGEIAPVDAIVLLGGGAGAWPESAHYPYPNLYEAADRAWHAARIWHSQTSKLPKLQTSEPPNLLIYCTGPDVARSTIPFLADFGVPTNCIVALDGPRNTEEEAKRYALGLTTNDCRLSTTRRPHIALVTSALHMKRAMLIFRKYAPQLDVVPCATDHQAVDYPGKRTHWQYWTPNLTALGLFTAVEHEFLGLIRYGLF